MESSRSVAAASRGSCAVCPSGMATHGMPEGATVDGQTIDVRSILDSVKDAPHLRLLHFSACLMMKDAKVVEHLGVLSKQYRLPVSGYATSVDWAASAIIEFTYLEMILSKGLTPAAAAEQVRKLLPFAGDDKIEGSPFPPAGFRVVLPEGK